MSAVLRVAAIQMNCEPGMVRKNLDHAEALVDQAARRGAKLVLLPELMPSGYVLTEELWNYAETISGSSVQWLLRMAKYHNIFLGFTFLEAKGEDFYNTFVLGGPGGTLLGNVRKSPPCSVEAYFFRSGADRHVIDTEIGRIGVGVCYENLLYDQIRFLHSENVDLILSPAAAGRPKAFIAGDVKRFEKMIVGCREVYAKTLGVPVIVANRTGPLETGLPANFPYLKSSFPGLSSIVDADGAVKAELEDEEGIIVADVTLQRSAGRLEKPKRYGKMWSVPVPWYAFIWPLTQRMGEKSYISNPRRKKSALSANKEIEGIV